MDDLVHQQELLALSSLLQGSESKVCQYGCDTSLLPVVTFESIALLCAVPSPGPPYPSSCRVGFQMVEEYSMRECTSDTHISCLLQGLRAALQVPMQEAWLCIGLLCVRCDVVYPAEVFRDGYSQIIACVYPVQDNVVQMVEVAEGLVPRASVMTLHFFALKCVLKISLQFHNASRSLCMCILASMVWMAW